MSGDIYVYSDPHFGHKNIIKFPRPDGGRYRDIFNTIEEHDEGLIERYNRVVRPQDKVYFLGDLGGGTSHLDGIMPRLNGHKRLLWGNHDKPQYGKYFEKIGLDRKFEDKGVVLYLTHIPAHRASFIHKGTAGRICTNVHGHLHYEKLDGPYLNVCVENTNFEPIHLEVLYLMGRVRGEPA